MRNGKIAAEIEKSCVNCVYTFQAVPGSETPGDSFHATLCIAVYKCR